MKLILLIIICVLLLGCETRQCLKSHKETFTQPARYEYTCLNGLPWDGNCTMYMKYIPEYEYEATVCDKYKEEEADV